MPTAPCYNLFHGSVGSGEYTLLLSAKENITNSTTYNIEAQNIGLPNHMAN